MVLFGPIGAQYGLFASTYFLALEQHLNPPAHAVIVGSEGDALTQELWRKALATYRPNKLVSLYDPAKSSPRSSAACGRGDDVHEKPGPQAYVCAGNTCALPDQRPCCS